MFVSNLTVFILLFYTVIAHPSPHSPSSAPHLIYKFPNSTYAGGIENIAVTSYGHLLLNTNEAPQTYLLDPYAKAPSAHLLAEYPEALVTLGLAKVSKDDVFAVVAGNWTSTLEGIPGSFAIWLLDVSEPSIPTKRLVTKIPEAHALNGLTTIPGSPHLVLVADSELGAVWSVNIKTGLYIKAIEDPVFANTTGVPIGINGIHVHDSTLYFTNSASGIFGKVGIDSRGMATSPIFIIARDALGDNFDDFAIDAHGNTFISNHPDTIVEVANTGVQRVVAKISGPTSAVLGNQIGAGRVLYVPTIEGKVYSVHVCGGWDA